MRIDCEQMFASLDQIKGQLPLPAILEWFDDHRLTAEDVAEYLVFSPERYVRNLWHTGPSYQALILCWKNG